MQDLTDDLKLKLMNNCDLQGLVSLGIVCKSYYRYYKLIQNYIRGWSHCDHFVQLTCLQQLLNDLKGNSDHLRPCYPLLFTQLNKYHDFKNRSIRNLYSYILLCILAVKMQDIDKISYAIEKLQNECIIKAQSYSLFHYSLCLINNVLSGNEQLKLAVQTILKEISTIKKPYHCDDIDIKKNAWLFKITLIDRKCLLNQRDHLIKQICLWFESQDSATSNSDVHRDMYLNMRWLMQGMSQENIFTLISDQFLPSLLPLFQYHYRQKNILELYSEEALDIFLLVGEENFYKLLNNKKFELSNKDVFLKLLTQYQCNEGIKKYDNRHPDSTPKKCESIILPVVQDTISIDYLEKSKFHNFQQLFNLLHSTPVDEKNLKRIHQLASSWLKSMSIEEINTLIQKFENQLTPTMRECIILQYHLCLPNKIRQDVDQDVCHAAYTILKRWDALHFFQEEIKSFLLACFNKINLNCTISFEFDVNFPKAVNCFSTYLKLFPEDNKTLYLEFYTKLKPVIISICRTRHSYSYKYAIRLHSLLLRISPETLNEIAHDLWLPIFRDGDPFQISTLVNLIEGSLHHVPNDLLHAKLIPLLLLPKKNIDIITILVKIYDHLTPQERQLFYDEPSPYQSIFVEYVTMRNHRKFSHENGAVERNLNFYVNFSRK